jgi:hypothetical protein
MGTWRGRSSLRDVQRPTPITTQPAVTIFRPEESFGAYLLAKIADAEEADKSFDTNIPF